MAGLIDIAVIVAVVLFLRSRSRARRSAERGASGQMLAQGDAIRFPRSPRGWRGRKGGLK